MEWAEPTAGKCSNLSTSGNLHPSKAWIQESSAPVGSQLLSRSGNGAKNRPIALGAPFGHIQNEGAALELRRFVSQGDPYPSLGCED